MESKVKVNRCWPPRVELDLWRFFYPLLAGEHGDAYRDAEESLRDCSVGARNGGREQEENC